jgi:type IV pilus assembly protein PilB
MVYSRREIISKKQLFGQILLKRGLITDEQLRDALEAQKKYGGVLGEILVKLGYLTERDVVVALIVQCGFPYIAVNKYDIDPKVLALLPEEKAMQFNAIPLDKVGDVLSVVMANPLDITTIEEIEKISNCKVATFIATKTEIEEAIKRCYSKKE